MAGYVHLLVTNYLESQLHENNGLPCQDIYEQIIQNCRQAIDSKGLSKEDAANMLKKLNNYAKKINANATIINDPFELKYPDIIEITPKKVDFCDIALPQWQLDEIRDLVMFPLQHWKQNPNGRVNVLIYGNTGGL